MAHYRVGISNVCRQIIYLCTQSDQVNWFKSINKGALLHMYICIYKSVGRWLKLGGPRSFDIYEVFCIADSITIKGESREDYYRGVRVDSPQENFEI